MPRSNATKAFAAAAISVGAIALADSPIAYDGANAPIGNIQGVVCGTNFAAWDAQNPGINAYNFGAGLYYPYLQTSGNAVYGGGVYTSAGVGISTAAAAFAPYRTGGSLGADGTTLWASAIVNNLTGYDGFALSLHDSGIRWNSGGNCVQVTSTGGYWHLTQNGGPDVSTDVKVDAGMSTLMVFRLDFQAGSSDRVTLYVNPTPGQATPSGSGTVLDTSSSFKFQSVGFYPGNDKLQGAIDELRFGSTYASVTPYDAAATPQTLPQRIRTYFIGNSVTDTINQEALRRTALARGEMMPWGRQMIPGSPLDNIIADPNGGFTAAPYGGYANALPNYTWDAVSLQPFDRQIASDKQSCKTLIDLTLTNPGNSNTEFLVYSRWPRKDSDGSLDYQAKWLRPYDGSFGSEESKAYFETLTTELRSMYPGKSIRMVPVGDVLFKLDQMMEAGEIAGYSDVIQLYADGIHFNNVGSFVTGMTYYATMYKQSPVGLPYAEYGLTDPVLANTIQQAVWSVVSTNPYAAVPEPTVLLLPATALIALGRRRRQCNAAYR